MHVEVGPIENEDALTRDFSRERYHDVVREADAGAHGAQHARVAYEEAQADAARQHARVGDARRLGVGEYASISRRVMVVQSLQNERPLQAREQGRPSRAATSHCANRGSAAAGWPARDSPPRRVWWRRTARRWSASRR